jgi:protein-disulfide isomerase
MPLAAPLRAAFVSLALLSPALLAGAATPAFAQAPAAAFTSAQRGEIEGVIRDYLLKNPEILRDALIELQRKEKAAEEARRAGIVADAKGKLFVSPHQAEIGNPNGAVTLVEFFDYNCGFCKRALDDLAKLVKAEPNLKVILKDFPVLGPQSVEAAQVASAVRNQLKGEKFFEFHQKLMSQKGRIGRAEALAVAKGMGLDMTKIAADMESPSVRAGIAETMQLGDALGLTGTPSYVVGKDIVVGAVGYDELKQSVDALVAAAQGKTADGKPAEATPKK